MADYLIALLRALLGSLLSLFGRVPAARYLRELLEEGTREASPAAFVFLLCLVVLLGTLAAVMFIWVLRRHPGRGRRAQLLQEVLPFEPGQGAPKGSPRREVPRAQ